MEETTQLIVIPPPELAVREVASDVVIDAKWRTIRERPYPGPAARPRSVVLPAALVAFAICVVPGLLVLLAEGIAR